MELTRRNITWEDNYKILSSFSRTGQISLKRNMLNFDSINGVIKKIGPLTSFWVHQLPWISESDFPKDEKWPWVIKQNNRIPYFKVCAIAQRPTVQFHAGCEVDGGNFLPKKEKIKFLTSKKYVHSIYAKLHIILFY